MRLLHPFSSPRPSSGPFSHSCHCPAASSSGVVASKKKLSTLYCSSFASGKEESAKKHDNAIIRRNKILFHPKQIFTAEDAEVAEKTNINIFKINLISAYSVCSAVNCFLHFPFFILNFKFYSFASGRPPSFRLLLHHLLKRLPELFGVLHPKDRSSFGFRPRNTAVLLNGLSRQKISISEIRAATSGELILSICHSYLSGDRGHPVCTTAPK